MKTLIELFDERPIENVLATEMFRPEKTVFICPPEIARNIMLRDRLKLYFRKRGVRVRLTFVPVSLLDAAQVEKKLRKELETNEDCAIDISGGTDATLFAAGVVSGETPVFTYSRKKNTFYNIRNAPFADGVPCTVHLNAEACFLMAGGSLQPGREDNRKLREMLPEIKSLFEIYRAYRRIWNRQISYFQRISQSSDPALSADGPRTAKADRGMVTADAGLLQALKQANLISGLRLTEDRTSFRFANDVVRFWLRDMGSVLELHVFRACLMAGCFDDVVLSAVVNWNGEEKRDAVSNEIDVMAIRGVEPMFISCKTSDIKTEALNELAILRDRFGGKGARAMIVTSAVSGKSRAIMRRRAQELGIEVVEWPDLTEERLIRRLKDPGVSGGNKN